MPPSDAASCSRRVAVWSAAFTSAITQAKLPSRSASSAMARMILSFLPWA